MTLFRKLWRALAASLEQPRSTHMVGLHSVCIDTRPSSAGASSHLGR